MAIEQNPPERRTRFEARVLRCANLTPGMRRIILGGPDVAGFLATEGASAPGARGEG